MNDTTLAPRTNYDRLKAMIKADDVKDRFQDILGERAPAFLTSVLSAVATNDNLKDCDPGSILTAALKAAVLDLPIDQNIGFAWIIPYKDHGIPKAQFQIGYRGFIQLAIRTNQYEAINTVEIYEGEEIKVDRLSGRVTLNGRRTGDTVIGYVAYFKLLGGLEKFLYMTVEEVEAHKVKFAKGYDRPDSAWKTNFNGMAKKTVLKNLLTHYGIMSVQMQKAFREDVPANGEDPRLAMPKFDDLTGEMLEGEFTEPLAPPEPEVQQEESAPNLTAQIIQAAIELGYTQNEHSARNTLKHHKDEFQNLEHGVLWFKQYRSYRDQGESAAKAAELASGKIAA